jgi:hypothetical protein
VSPTAVRDSTPWSPGQPETRLALWLVVSLGVAVKRRWTRACPTCVAVVVAAVACGAAAVTPAAASSTFGNTVLNSVTCTSAGNCVAVGYYVHAAADQRQQAMVVSETNGAWGAASELELPAPALGGELNSVACTSAGNCVAVGDYEPRAYREEAMVATETGGAWAPANELALPAPALGGQLNSVTCTSPGNCAAVGGYQTSSSDPAMVVSEAAGVWGAATPVTLGAVSTGVADLNSVTCTSAGNCVAVGAHSTYQPSASSEEAAGGGEAIVATETGGTWAPASELLLPAPALAAEQNATLNSVTCTSPGNCAAVGGYQASSSYPAMVVSAAAGVWGVATPVTLGAATPGVADLNSVTCTSAGSCVAVGSVGEPSQLTGLLATETGGVWGQAAPLGSSLSRLRSVFCTSLGNCVAVGADAAAMAVTETNGTWGQPATLAPPPSIQSRAVLSQATITNRHSAKFSFKAKGVASGFECALVRVARGKRKRAAQAKYSACHSPKTYRRLAAASYVFYVRPLAPAGTVIMPASRRFTVT